MRTTVELPDELLREAKAVAARRGVPLKSLIAKALDNEIHTPAATSSRNVRSPLVRSKRRKKLDITSTEIEEILAGSS